MKIKICFLYLTSIWILSAGLTSLAHARPTIIELSVDSQLMEKRKVFVNNKFAGYTKDFIALTERRNYFEINTQFGGSLTFTIMKMSRYLVFSKLQVVSYKASTKKCLDYEPNPYKISEWKKPAIDRLSKFRPNWFRLSISTPIFVKTTLSADQTEHDCVVMAKAGWRQIKGSFILDIKSEPDDAELFINNRRYPDKLLSIPYEEDSVFNIVIRKTGYVVYTRTLKGPFKGRETIIAKLVAVK